MAPWSLPPYLTSGASSRAHHALLVRLNDAKSEHEEDDVISREVEKAKEVLSVKGQSMAKIADTLIILLHCAMLRHQSGESDEFALVSALQLAEGGRKIEERRIGYLYLVERLPRKHELHLMLINTIRKDLSSSTPSHILLALHTISKLPSSDLGPAVAPLLTSNTLLRHKVPAVRQRTLEALISLHHMSGTHETPPFPLSMSKIIRSIGDEKDLPVLSVLLKVARHVIECGSHKIESDEEREYVVEKVLNAARGKVIHPNGQVGLEVLRTLRTVIATSETPSMAIVEPIGDWVISMLEKSGDCQRWERAFLLETCHLVQSIPSASGPCLSLINGLLLPKHSDPSSSSSLALPPPNGHALAINCLAVLPTNVWDGVLGEKEMKVIMEGVNSADDTIRRMTIRLFNRLSPELLQMIYQGYMNALRESSNLSLPLLLSANLTIEEKTRIGRYETAIRGLEVVEVGYDTGDEHAERVLALLDALEGGEPGVWENGARRVLEGLKEASTTFTQDFILAFIHTLGSEPQAIRNTAIVILTTAVCEYLPPYHPSSVEAISILTRALSRVQASVQELVLIALVYLLAGLDDDKIRFRQSVLEAVRGLTHTSKYLKKRCNQVVTLIENDLIHEVMSKSKSRAMSDVLDVMTEVAARHCASVNEHQSSPIIPPSTALPRRDLTASRLRYDAYEAPRGSDRSEYRDQSEENSDVD